nr:hypothetical protein B0A51_10350 [Rachicladosporium sp. CCFEE 5018]
MLQKVEDLSSLRLEHNRLQREIVAQRVTIQRPAAERPQARVQELLVEVHRLETQLHQVGRITPELEEQAQLDAELEEYFERQLTQDLETAQSQSANDAQQLKQELETTKRMSKIQVNLLKKQHDAAQRQYKVVLLQLKQDRETIKHASGAEIEQLKQELEALRAEQERTRTKDARLNVRIKNMDEDELRGLYESGAELVGLQMAKIAELRAEVVKLTTQHETILQRGANQELLTRNREFAATDAAQRQVIQRLDAEVEGLKGKLKLADDQATEREKVMTGHVNLIEDYKKHLADVKMSD